MAAFFLLLAVLIGVVLVDAVLENTTASSITLFNRSFDQLSNGELLVVFAGLGCLLALFLFLAFGSSRTRRSKRKELRSRRRDAEGRVDELERENTQLRQELTRTREEAEGLERDRADVTTERDRAEAAADRLRADRTGERDQPGATLVDDRPPVDETHPTGAEGSTEPVTPVRDEHARAADEHDRAADEHDRAADEHARAADEDARRR